MKQTQARNIQVCSICDMEISVGDYYLSSPYTSLCVKCGKKYKSGELVYSRKDKKYVNISDSKRKCMSCENIATTFRYSKASCDDHIGDLKSDTPWNE